MTKTSMQMRLANFTNDALGYIHFNGYTKGESWNGWDCPYFNFEQAQQILKEYNEIQTIINSDAIAYYDNLADAFVFPTSSTDEPEIYQAIFENNEKYYPVGAFSWIWEESTN